MIDLKSTVVLSIEVAANGKIVWVNTEDGCQLRCYNPSTLIIKDNRPHQYLIDAWHGLTKLMKQWRPETESWASICEARRLIEGTMKFSGIPQEQINKLSGEHEEYY